MLMSFTKIMPFTRYLRLALYTEDSNSKYAMKLLYSAFRFNLE